MLKKVLEYLTGNLYKKEELQAENYIRNFLGGKKRNTNLLILRLGKGFVKTMNPLLTVAELGGYVILNNDNATNNMLYSLEVLALEVARNCMNFTHRNHLMNLIRKRDEKGSKLRYHSLSEIQNDYEQRRTTKGGH